MFDNFPAGGIEHLTQGIIVGEAGLVLSDLTELAVETLDDIGRVYDFPIYVTTISPDSQSSLCIKSKDCFVKNNKGIAVY